MTSLKTLRASVTEPRSPAFDAALRLAAVGLRSASAMLTRLSHRLVRPAVRTRQPVPQLEFYSEAGAPEGALYLDGQLVGWVTGVKRL
jgi:hypothetical protein